MNTHSGDRKPSRSRARVSLATAIILWLAFCFALIVPSAARAQQWQSIATPFGVNPSTAMLLTDGTVIMQNLLTPDWWKLTPDSSGSYANGTWSQIASLPNEQGQPFAPLYYGSAVLADGRVVVFGGEYNGPFSGEVWFNGGAIYDPLADTWTELANPGWANIGDAASVVFPDGTFMLQDPFGSDVAVLDPVSLTWSSPTPPRLGNYGKADPNDEEGWTLLPDGTIMTVDTLDVGNSEIFDPIYGDWYTAGSTINVLPDIASEEMGPQVLRPDGTTVVFGASGFNSIYNWIGSTTQSPAPGKWEVLQSFPFYDDGLGDPPVQFDCGDAPACLLPNGNVLVCVSPGIFNPPVAFYEVSATNNRLIAEPNVPNALNLTSFNCVFLTLPNGQILMTSQNPGVNIYTPAGGPNPAWAPAITSSPAEVTPGQTYTIYGTQFNGLSQASAYGDDVQNATNYPLVRITMQSTGHVVYYRTHDHSTMAVATGNTTVSTNFDVPLGAETGAAQIVVVSNGIPSLPVPISIVPPPVALPETIKVPHNTATNFFLNGTDPSGLPLIYSIVTEPTKGTLSNFNPTSGFVTYTPNTNYDGPDSFTFMVSDGAFVSVPGTVTLIVAPGTPVALPQTVAVGHDAGVSIKLMGADPTDNPPPPLKFAIAKQPTNGTLSFLNANTGTVTYQPKANFQGKDSFTFTVNNGVLSAPATVSLNVAPATPFANNQVVGVGLNTAKVITLTGTDPDVPSLPLTFAIFSTPAHGTLSGLSPSTGMVTYTPTTGFKGDDTFTFTVSNGPNISARGTVTLVVAPSTPTANAQTVTAAHNTTTVITLTGSDPDVPQLPLTFAIVTSPTHGTLSGLNTKTGAVTYTPTAAYQGKDSFTFTVNNGVNTSKPATVTINVSPGTPTANAQTVAVSHNIAKAITLSGSDPDIPVLPLTYTLVTQPAHGAISGFNPFSSRVTYTPTANYHGNDSFTFTVSNGVNTSAPATVTLIVAIGTPTANAQTVAVVHNTAKSITLTGTDLDNPTLTLKFTIATAPTHGTLTGLNTSTGAVTYTPNANYTGADSFTFQVNNGTNTSTAAKVTINVSGPGA